MLSSYQVGFRKGQGVEDQVLAVTQKISDGLQRKEKSLLAMLDFSKAYYTILRHHLIPFSTSASQAGTLCGCRVFFKTDKPEFASTASSVEARGEISASRKGRSWIQFYSCST